MSISTYFSGLAWIACAFSPLVFAAVRLRRRILPDWAGGRARLVEALLVLSGSLVVAYALGAFGSFHRWPVALACVVVGIVVIASARPRSLVPPRPVGQRDDPSGRLAVVDVLAIAFAAFAVARWVPRTLDALRGGITESDTLNYHLPHAVRFVQDGWLTRLHFVTPSDTIPYHPSNGEVYHAYGVLAFGRDFLSPVMNIGWLLFALCAAWVLGDRWKKGSLAVVATATVFTLPVMVSHQAGSAHTDVVAIAFFLAALAMLVHADGRGAPIALAGVAAGVALGCKFSMIAPVALVTLGFLVVAIRSKRPLSLLFWGVPLVASGSFWYLRNLVRVGNPVPSMKLGVGSVALPRIPMELIDRHGYSVADYAFEPRIWREWFLPGLDAGFGDAWIALVLLCGLGVAVSTRASPLVAKVFGVVSVGTVLAWAFTPTTAFGVRGRPEFFLFNLRYAVPGLLVALIAVHATSLPKWVTWTFVGVCGVVLLVELPHDWHGHAGLAILAGLAFAALLVGARYLGRSAALTAVGLSAVVLLAIVTTYPVADRYIDGRFGVSQRSAADRDPYVWAQHIRDAHIGVVGFFINYPLYGSDLSNRVDYAGELHEDNSFTDHRSCGSFRRDVNTAGFDYVVTQPAFPVLPEPRAASWLDDPAVTQVAGQGKARVFQIDGDLDPEGCRVAGRSTNERARGSGS